MLDGSRSQTEYKHGEENDDCANRAPDIDLFRFNVDPDRRKEHREEESGQVEPVDQESPRRAPSDDHQYKWQERSQEHQYSLRLLVEIRIIEFDAFACPSILSHRQLLLQLPIQGSL